MEIYQVSEILQSAGFGTPTLDVLAPNANNYKTLVLQPHGNIEVSSAGVRNQDQDLAALQFGNFLGNAIESQADLVVTPEYSMPWRILTTAIKEEKVPTKGKIWALGCESIKYNELEALKEELTDHATLVYENLQADQEKFISPLAYVFLAPRENDVNTFHPVVLIQFKTHPMGDPDHFEINGMQRGTCIYHFNNTGQSLNLIGLICADAFSLEDAQASEIYDRALIIHIQMNQNPRHEWFCGCRERLLRYSGDETEILCLNWSAGLTLWHDDQAQEWNNIAGSAWYLKSKEFDDTDATLTASHQRGLYYTWLKPQRTHALFFNFNPAVYMLTVSKVAHIAVAGPISRRRGPQLTNAYTWDDADESWSEQVSIEDGFSDIISESGDARSEIKRISDDNPFEAERVLALCAGKVMVNQDWYKPQNLDSCVINSTEVIKRITFAQDSHPEAQEFRTARLRRCHRMWGIINTAAYLPPALSDLNDGFIFQWVPNYPQQNVIARNGNRATVVYMGDDCNAQQAEDTLRKLADYLSRSSTNPDQSLSARQRLAVWFRDDANNIVQYDPQRYVKIDKADDTSEFDIGRDS